MLKHLSPKTRLSIAGVALLAVAFFAVLFFMNRNSNGAPYVPNYPYMPPQTNGQNGEPNETSQGPFKCGEVPTKDANAPSGWIVENDQYLCLSVPHPSNWRLIGSRDLPPEGLPGAVTVQMLREGEMETPVALIYPFKESDSKIPLLDLTLAEVRALRANVGTAEMPIYQFDPMADPASGGTKRLQHFLVHVPALDRVYLIVGHYPNKALVGIDVSPDVRQMILGTTAF
ncbi:MAG: hypothetical protein QY323_01405 [Patescibacteria group bacterium]|nr:MAG: hypothetical protein QY323_01405 [Patescibacteria group bacterium]